jgi:hypothetical protein
MADTLVPSGRYPDAVASADDPILHVERVRYRVHPSRKSVCKRDHRVARLVLLVATVVEPVNGAT